MKTDNLIHFIDTYQFYFFNVIMNIDLETKLARIKPESNSWESKSWHNLCI